MFVRSEVGESEMWILDEERNIDTLVKDNIDYCNLQGKLLSDIDNSIYRDSSDVSSQRIWMHALILNYTK